MDQETQTLVDKINATIPAHTWNIVRQKIVETIVDYMDSNTLFRLAEMSLNEYYNEHQDQLIFDIMDFVGPVETCNLLYSLQLEQIPKPNEEND